MNSIIDNLLSGQADFDNLDDLIQQLIKDFLEKILEAELTEYLGYEKHSSAGNNSGNSRNGSYDRDLNTKYGNIENLEVPRDRNGDFDSALFKPYQRRDNWLEEMIIKMYANGVSTRDIAEVIEKMYGSHYSASTVSNITDVALEELEKWHNRELKDRYSVIFIDGMSIKLRREHVENESLYVIVGIDTDGYREILDFCIGATESASLWEETLNNLKKRGLKEVLLGVMDGLTGLKDAFLNVFPKADVQRCVTHKVRNTMAKVRKKHSDEITEDLKAIYGSPNRDYAEQALEEFKTKWEDIYPKVTTSWEANKDELLAFYKYPASIRKGIYTTNWIERAIKEIRKKTKTKNSLPNLNAAKKLVYMAVTDYNEKWANRRKRGFLKAKEKLLQLFKERYE